jgi:transcriptional regulator with XRE-family HTH domain
MRQYFQQRLFAIHLKQFREKHNISQQEVGVLIGATGGHISRLESGKLEDHKMFPLLALCDLMQVDIRDYFSPFKEKF